MDRGRERDRSRDRDDYRRSKDRDDRSRDRKRDRSRERGDRDDRAARTRDDEPRSKPRDRDDRGDRDSKRRRRSPSESRSRSPVRDRSRTRSRSRSPDDNDDGRKGSSSKRRKHRETSEERAARKAEKKKLKEELKKQKESQMVAQMAINLGIGYTDKDNPFNDTNLTQKFVWAKKVESERKSGLNEQQRLAIEKKRRDEAMSELEKLNRKRAEREEEIRLREEEAERLRREQERAKLGDWEQKELEFHLEQAKRRAQIRIKEGRAKPIDVLAMNLSLATDGAIADEFDAMGLEMEMDEPYTIFQQGLQLEDVEELEKDIRMYLELEHDEMNIEFWKAMLVVCDDELSKHRDRISRSRKPGVSAQVLADIDKLLRDKNFEQLTILQKQVEAKLASGGPVDVEYWEALMKGLLVWKAKARLKDMHRIMLRKRLERLREKQKEETEDAAAAGGEDVKQPIKLQLQSSLRKHAEAVEAAEGEGEQEEFADEAAEVEAYDPSMSPRLLPQIPRDDMELEVLDEEEDIVALAEKRRQVLEQHVAAKPKPKPVAAPVYESNDDRLWREEAAKEMDMDEEVFASEVVAETKSYMWQDKYRPRKPRYFNRVHTGYEWNKYNQTHYDTDNPPPKVVQGYKFNIFYPDLIDKSKAPSFKIIKDKANPDLALIKFTAGPPYEDIAFSIVNKEWEHSHKKGFRCVFDRGVLQLHFRFKRHFYRK